MRPTLQMRLRRLIVGSRREQIDFSRGIEIAGLESVIDRNFRSMTWRHPFGTIVLRS